MRALFALSASLLVLLGCSQEQPRTEVRYVPVPVLAPAERLPAVQQPAPVQTVYVPEDDSMEEYWEDREEGMECQATFSDDNPSNDPPGDAWGC